MIRCPACRKRMRQVVGRVRDPHRLYVCPVCDTGTVMSARLPPSMRCQNCGGRMLRASDRAVTYCAGADGRSRGCGMRHDWSEIENPRRTYAKDIA